MRTTPRKKSKTYNLGMMALLFLCAIYIIIYPHIIAPNQAKTEDDPAESSSYEKVENAAEVITGTDEAVTSAAEAAIAAIEEKEKIAASATYSFRSDEKLRSHFEKHGHEMGFSTQKEYLDAANALINNPEALHKTEAEDGDAIYYLESTDEIAFVSTDGYIRTYFICSGKDYFERQ